MTFCSERSYSFCPHKVTNAQDLTQKTKKKVAQKNKEDLDIGTSMCVVTPN